MIKIIIRIFKVNSKKWDLSNFILQSYFFELTFFTDFNFYLINIMLDRIGVKNYIISIHYNECRKNLPKKG